MRRRTAFSSILLASPRQRHMSNLRIQDIGALGGTTDRPVSGYGCIALCQMVIEAHINSNM